MGGRWKCGSDPLCSPEVLRNCANRDIRREASIKEKRVSIIFFKEPLYENLIFFRKSFKKMPSIRGNWREGFLSSMH